MASTNSTVDGMGFEEMNQVGSQAANIWIAGSMYAEQHIRSAKYFTTPGSVYAEDAILSGDLTATNATIGNVKATGSVVDANGTLNSVAIQNAAEVFGYRVVAGSVTTDDAGEGVVLFPSAGSFSSPNYFITFTANQYTIPGASGLNVGASGTRRASGLEILGPSGTTFDWIAVGI